MKTAVHNLQQAIRAAAGVNENCPVAVPDVTACRFISQKIQMPQTENPYLYLVLDGALRLHTPSGMMDYMAGQYSVSQIDTPLSGTVLSFSQQGDFLAAAVEFSAGDVITTALELDNDLMEKIAGGKLQERTMLQSDASVVDAVWRLMSAAHETVPSDFLRKNRMREVIYQILCGSCGRQLLQSIANFSQAAVHQQKPAAERGAELLF